MSEYTLWCLIEGDKDVFCVTILSSLSIGELKCEIKEQLSHTLEKFAAQDLILWKLDVDYDGLVEESIRNGQYQPLPLPAPNDKPLDAMETISDLWHGPLPNRHIHILVSLPGKMFPVAHASTNDLGPVVTLSTKSRGLFESSDTVEQNNIHELDGTEPDFLTEFRIKLEQCRWIESGTEDLVDLLRNKLPQFDDYFQPTPVDVEQPSRISNELVLWHLASAFMSVAWKEDNIEEASVRWIFDNLAGYFRSILGPRERHAFGDDWPSNDWPSKFIVYVESEEMKSRYTPQSDFCVALDRLVYLLVQVQSDKDRHDKYRMLLQAACAARLGRVLYNNPFIIVALYIENSGKVTRYFVFQRDGSDPKVSYVKDCQDWKEPDVLFKAMFELYNLVSIIQSDRPEPGNIEARIESLTWYISNNFHETLYLNKTHHDGYEDGNSSAERSRVREGQGSNIGLGVQYGDDVYEDPKVVKGFTRAGYTLESNDEDENGWAPLNQLRPTMRYARRWDDTPVVVKLLRPRSNELRILQRLHSMKLPDNPAIPLIGTLELNLGTFIIFPTAYPLDLELTLGTFSSSTVVDLSRQLIAGVGFLHRHGIAHLDIKPGNMVVLGKKLLIIDFDISVCVNNPDTLIDRWCGTPRWMAPEIGHEDGPQNWYSPIRADLWSCGRTLKDLANEGRVKENPFEALIRRLLNEDPRRRPLLHLDGVEHLFGKPQVTLKRKASASPLL